MVRVGLKFNGCLVVSVQCDRPVADDEKVERKRVYSLGCQGQGR